MTRLTELLIDLAGIAGAALVVFGAWSIYEPSGYVVGGALLVLGAVLLSRG